MSVTLTAIKGVGPAQAEKFAALGVHTLRELITYWPRRYDDYSDVLPMAAIKPGLVTVQGTIGAVKSRYVRRGLHITEAIASDATGSVKLVWFNQPYRAGALKNGQSYLIAGEYALKAGRFSLQNPSLEAADSEALNTGRIVPVYRETKGLTSRQIRAAVAGALQLAAPADETLPDWLVTDQKLMDYPTAVRAMHFPDDAKELTAARRRLAFEEVFALSLASQLTKRDQRLEPALSVPFEQSVAQDFVKALPFDLTDDQRAAAWQIFQDITHDHPMNRLLEGDVGAGKTVVAALAAVMVLHAGYQVAVMAPTELLAQQHAATLHKLLAHTPYQHKLLVLTGSQTAAQKRNAHAAIANGEAGLLVGTQALIQDKVKMPKLALVIIDEQHRFGVEQRQALQLKAGHMPHLLSMTATPIPRSLALTLYGELDLSLLKHKPAERLPIRTELVPPSSRPDLYKKVYEQLDAGRQVYVVCPLVADSAALDLQSAEATYERLKTHEFHKYRVGLLHGQLPAVEKQLIMDQFVAGDIDVLVATTVIEVGVDVPNATTMLIESPERFGLAQLHQLRGRVGRAGHQSYCYLLLSDAQSPNQRLRALASSQDGFKLSELDLQLRGPGAIYGRSQHGALDLRLAQLTDIDLIAAAQTAAKTFMKREPDLLQYTELAATVARLQTITNLN